MRIIASLTVGSLLSLVALPAAADGPPKRSTPSSAPTSTTETTSAETTSTAVPATQPDPAAAAREKAAKESEKKKADAEARAGIQIAPLFAYGLHSTQLRDGFLGTGAASEKIGAMGVGGGVRAGNVFGKPVTGMYVGGSFLYHLGESKNVEGGKAEGSLAYGGIELGQQIAAGPVLLRPYAGVGFASVTLKAPIDGKEVDASGGHLSLWPGVTALVPIGDHFFAGADARYLWVIGVGENASVGGFAFAATGGIKL